MTNHPLKNQIILVTGASGALGRMAAKTCAAAGATVILMGRRIPPLERLYDEITLAGDLTPAILPLDLAKAGEQHYEELATTIREELGGLTGLIHCAAELGHLSPLSDIDSLRWQRLLQVNLTAPYMLTRAVLRLMLDSTESGNVVFVGDSGVADGRAFWGAYGVAKIALAGFGRILNAETESLGLRTHLWTPGPMRTSIRLRAYPGENPRNLPGPEIHAEQIIRLFSPDNFIQTS